MNKEEAAKTLGRSVRVLQRYVAQGRLTVVYDQTKSGRKAVFDPEEIGHLKEELNKPRLISAGLSTIEEQTAPMTAMTPMTSYPSQAIGAAIAAGISQSIGEAVERLIAALEANKPNAHAPALLACKLTLSLSEAATLSGLSETALLKAIQKKKLKAIQVEKAIRIKRAALEKFIAKL